MSDERQGDALSVAASALDQALSGDQEAWPRAEAAYGRAARASLLDNFPLWVLELMRAWKAGASPSDDPTIAQALAVLGQGDYRGAQAAAERLEDTTAKEFVLRLIADLTLAAQARMETPEPR